MTRRPAAITATAALFMLSAALDDTELLEYIGNALNTCPDAEGYA